MNEEERVISEQVEKNLSLSNAEKLQEEVRHRIFEALSGDVGTLLTGAGRREIEHKVKDIFKEMGVESDLEFAVEGNTLHIRTPAHVDYIQAKIKV